MVTKNQMKRKGKEFEVTASIDESGKVTSVSLNGCVSENISYSETYKVYFSAMNFDGENYWVSVYRNKPHLCIGGDSMTEEDFVRDYAPPAFNSIETLIIGLLGVILPNLAVIMYSATRYPDSSIMPYVVMLSCGMIIFNTINKIPAGSRANRRKICFLSVLSAVASIGLLWLTNMNL